MAICFQVGRRRTPFPDIPHSPNNCLDRTIISKMAPEEPRERINRDAASRERREFIHYVICFAFSMIALVLAYNLLAISEVKPTVNTVIRIFTGIVLMGFSFCYCHVFCRRRHRGAGHAEMDLSLPVISRRAVRAPPVVDIYQPVLPPNYYSLTSETVVIPVPEDDPEDLPPPYESVMWTAQAPPPYLAPRS